MPSVYFPTAPRGNGSLPLSVYQEKMNGGRPGHRSWLSTVYVALPGSQKRHIRIFVPVMLSRRMGKKRGIAFSLLLLSAICFFVFALGKRFGTPEKQWPAFHGDPPTLIFKPEDLRRVWQWEIDSGHYPSRQSLTPQLGFKTTLYNPALPPQKRTIPSRFRPPPGTTFASSATTGTGPDRAYLDVGSQYPSVAYPPRPVPGSIADLDIVMDHCDFSQKKFVRDCLEVLRVGAGLDNGKRIRRGKLDAWKYIFVEEGHPAYNDTNGPQSHAGAAQPDSRIQAAWEKPAYHYSNTLPDDESEDDTGFTGFTKRRGVDWEVSPISLPPPGRVNTPYSQRASPCDPDFPRIFHMFWTGPFTDKPYLALLSFLYTQNVGLFNPGEEKVAVCRPQFWLWINPGPAAAVPNSSAVRNMYDQLKGNKWAAPFLHPRFKDVIQFKLWNTTEQLDGVPEIKDHWRNLGTLFNSGGHMVNIKSKKSAETEEAIDTTTTAGGSGGVETKARNNVKPTKEGSDADSDNDDMENRLGSKSASSYDRLSVILSDMARFVLCHRFGGIYLDADTIFLRDWEELWGWRGAFAYRWSRLEKYNTAVLRLNKGSALGTFLFRTALKNELDFHPMTISRYMKDAQSEGLLLRLPDALFDAAWLNTEYYQRERPPQPFFTEFGDFFDTPMHNSAAPQALGFEGFFRGSFSYHFHNFWWKPFDPVRNFPDLGERFGGEEQHGATKSSPLPFASSSPTAEYESVEDDRRDLDWAMVLKRTFEAHIRGEIPNMYGEYIEW